MYIYWIKSYYVFQLLNLHLTFQFACYWCLYSLYTKWLCWKFCLPKRKIFHLSFSNVGASIDRIPLFLLDASQEKCLLGIFNTIRKWLVSHNRHRVKCPWEVMLLHYRYLYYFIYWRSCNCNKFNLRNCSGMFSSFHIHCWTAVRGKWGFLKIW